MPNDHAPKKKKPKKKVDGPKEAKEPKEPKEPKTPKPIVVEEPHTEGDVNMEDVQPTPETVKGPKRRKRHPTIVESEDPMEEE